MNKNLKLNEKDDLTVENEHEEDFVAYVRKSKIMV